MITINIVRTDSADHGFIELVRLLDKELDSEYGEQMAFYRQFNKIDKIKHVVVAYSDGIAVGCGAIKEYDDESAEVKRMFVKSEYRGQQIAKTTLNQLEMWAKELGFSHTI